MPTIQYPKHPNTDTAFVIQDDGKKNRALMIAPQDITSLELPKNPNSTKGYVTVSGKKQRVVLTADISGSGGGGGGAVTSVNGKTGDVVLTAKDVDALAQFDTMPAASADNANDIVQYTGTTDANYTNGYFYKCVSDGQNPATYSWSNIQVQASSGGLPSQTGQSGKFLTTDGTDASWGNEITNPLAIQFTSMYNAVVIRFNYYTTTKAYIQYSDGANTLSFRGDNIPELFLSGFGGQKSIYSMSANVDLGSSSYKWANVYTTKINNGSDITVPAVAGEMAVKQVNTTITLTAAGWSNSSQTVSVTGMTATGVVLVSPDPTDQADYTSAGIICSAQAAGTLTFTCSTTPTNDIDVVVVML